MYGRKAAEEWEGSKSEGMEEEDGRSEVSEWTARLVE